VVTRQSSCHTVVQWPVHVVIPLEFFVVTSNFACIIAQISVCRQPTIGATFEKVLRCITT
jgi:hypothetical protein